MQYMLKEKNTYVCETLCPPWQQILEKGQNVERYVFVKGLEDEVLMSNTKSLSLIVHNL